jgi:hypothetical protein
VYLEWIISEGDEQKIGRNQTAPIRAVERTAQKAVTYKGTPRPPSNNEGEARDYNIVSPIYDSKL